MATTTNFGWETPDDTDLVKDGAAAIRTALGGVDTSFVDLKGGTTGQILSKASNTDLDYTWVTTDDANAIQNAIVDAKGDLITATAADTPARLAVGATNGMTLQVDSSTSTGLKWATPASGLTLIARTSFSAVASQAFDSVFTSTYKSYLVVIENLSAATSSDKLHLQFRYSSTTQAAGYYGNNIYAGSNSATVTNDFSNNVTFQIIAQSCGSSTNPGSGFMYISNVGTGSQTANANGMYNSNQQGNGGSFNCASTTARSYDGFLLKSASTNISGTVAIYGMAAA